MRLRTTTKVLDAEEERRTALQGLREHQRLHEAMRSGKPELERSRLTFGRFSAVTHEDGRHFRLVRGEILDAQFPNWDAWYVDPFGRASSSRQRHEPHGHHRFRASDYARALLQPGSVRAGRVLYDRGAFRLLRPDLPILVDHDDNRQIGVVREMFVHADPGGEWLCALARIEDPPRWLRRGARASCGYNPLWKQAVGEWTWLKDGLLLEVSVLSELTPAESGACVRTFNPADDSPEEINDRPVLLRRPNIGQVLAVR